MPLGSIFHHISFRSTILQSFTFRSLNQKIQKYLLYLLFSFIYLYRISLSQVTVKGLTTPLSRWGASCLIVCAGIGDLCVVSYRIDTLVLKLREILISNLLHHLSSSREKTTQA